MSLENITYIDISQLLLTWAVVVFASVLRSFTGFGFALAAIPVFSLFLVPTQAVVLCASLSLVVSCLNLRTFWGEIPLRPMLPLLLLALVGTVVGAAILSLISADQFQLWVGLSVIVACVGLTFFQPSTRWKSPALTGFTGLISGLMNGALAIPGPPMIIYAMLTEPEPKRSRALLMTFFLASSLIALVSYGAAGFIKLQSVWYFLLALPALYVGDKLGYYLFQRFGDGFYRRIALVSLVAIGVTITLKALL
ncbi:MAG: sulfite exporter TauE/SafE family protein [Pseudomonadales bacterium]